MSLNHITAAPFAASTPTHKNRYENVVGVQIRFFTLLGVERFYKIADTITLRRPRWTTHGLILSSTNNNFYFGLIN